MSGLLRQLVGQALSQRPGLRPAVRLRPDLMPEPESPQTLDSQSLTLTPNPNPNPNQVQTEALTLEQTMDADSVLHSEQLSKGMVSRPASPMFKPEAASKTLRESIQAISHPPSPSRAKPVRAQIESNHFDIADAGSAANSQAAINEATSSLSRQINPIAQRTIAAAQAQQEQSLAIMPKRAESAGATNERRQLPAQLAAPDVHIHIGRIELTALNTPPPSRRERSTGATQTSTLDNYLQRRGRKST